MGTASAHPLVDCPCTYRPDRGFSTRCCCGLHGRDARYDLVQETRREIARRRDGVQSPVPVNGAVCGLPLALSVIETEPVRVPVAVGLKVTLMVQLAPEATL